MRDRPGPGKPSIQPGAGKRLPLSADTSPLRECHNLVITGPTGIGKSYLSCAFVERACRRGFTATYVRMPRLLHQIAVARGDGSYARLLSRLARLDLLAIDDWLLAPLRDGERRTEAKQDVLYYENIEGGHGGAADNKQAAHMSALAYTFLWSRLR